MFKLLFVIAAITLTQAPGPLPPLAQPRPLASELLRQRQRHAKQHIERDQGQSSLPDINPFEVTQQTPSQGKITTSNVVPRLPTLIGQSSPIKACPRHGGSPSKIPSPPAAPLPIIDPSRQRRSRREDVRSTFSPKPQPSQGLTPNPPTHSQDKARPRQSSTSDPQTGKRRLLNKYNEDFTVTKQDSFEGDDYHYKPRRLLKN